MGAVRRSKSRVDLEPVGRPGRAELPNEVAERRLSDDRIHHLPHNSVWLRDCRLGQPKQESRFPGHAPEIGEEFAFHGCFHEVGEDRIVQTFTFDGEPDDVALETRRFEDLGDGRTRLHAQSLVDSFEGRDQWLASGMESGVEEGYAKLDALLAEL